MFFLKKEKHLVGEKSYDKLTCGIFFFFNVVAKKKWYKWTYLQNRADLENKLMSPVGKDGGARLVRKFGMDTHTAS